jgi:hypothetical protein
MHENIEGSQAPILGIFAPIARTGLPTILFRLKISLAVTKFVMNVSVETSTESANNSK